MGSLATMARHALRERRRFAPLVVLVGAALVGSTLYDALPREVTLRYDLGERREALRELRIAYCEREGGAELIAARFDFVGGEAPRSIDHAVELRPGRYAVKVALLGEGVERTLERRIEVPTEGVVRIALNERRSGL